MFFFFSYKHYLLQRLNCLIPTAMTSPCFACLLWVLVYLCRQKYCGLQCHPDNLRLCCLKEKKCISKHDLIMLGKDLEYSDHGEGSMGGGGRRREYNGSQGNLAIGNLSSAVLRVSPLLLPAVE